jgi:hypothetical protein
MLPLPLSAVSRLRLAAVALLLIIAGVHFQQYVDFISEVPKVGVLFLLNAAGGAGLALALISQERLLRLLAGVGGIGLAVGSLVSIIIALSGNFLGYSEPTLRFPIVLAIVAEAAVLPLLIMLARTDAQPQAAGVAVSQA